MKQTLIGLILGLFSVGALASVPAVLADNEAAFTISTNADWGGYVYYDCDSVEAAAEDFLAEMGAMDIRARCTGGLENGQALPAHLRVEFVNAIAAKSTEATHQANYRMVEMRGSKNRGHGCMLMKDIYRNLAGMFDTRSVNARFSCNSSFSQRYTIDLESLAL